MTTKQTAASLALAAVSILFVGLAGAAPTQGPQAVIVQNPATSPVPTRDVDERDREYFSTNIQVDCPNQFDCHTNFVEIPPARRAVVEWISCQATVPTGSAVWMAVGRPPAVGYLSLTSLFTSSGTDTFSGSQSMKLYLDHNDLSTGPTRAFVSINVFPFTSTASSAHCVVSGYLTDAVQPMPPRPPNS